MPAPFDPTHPLRQRPFPVQGGHDPVTRHSRPATSCSWADAERAYLDGYAREYPSSAAGQSLERIAERGGFGRGEMDLFAPGWTALS